MFHGATGVEQYLVVAAVFLDFVVGVGDWLVLESTLEYLVMIGVCEFVQDDVCLLYTSPSPRDS